MKRIVDSLHPYTMLSLFLIVGLICIGILNSILGSVDMDFLPKENSRELWVLVLREIVGMIILGSSYIKKTD